MTLPANKDAERVTGMEMGLFFPESEPNSQLNVLNFLELLVYPQNETASEESIVNLFSSNTGPFSFIFTATDSDDSLEDIYRYPIVFCPASDVEYCEKIESKIGFKNGDSLSVAKRVRVGGCNFYYGHDQQNKSFPAIKTVQYIYQIYRLKFIAKFFLSLSEEKDLEDRRYYLEKLFPDEEIDSLSVDRVCEKLEACTSKFAGPAIEGEFYSYMFATERLRDLLNNNKGTNNSILGLVNDAFDLKAYTPSPMLISILHRGLNSIIDIADAALEESVVSDEQRELANMRLRKDMQHQEVDMFTSTLRRLIASYAARLFDYGYLKHCISEENPSSKQMGFEIYFQHLLQSAFPTRPDETALFFSVLHKELVTHLSFNGNFEGTWGRLESAADKIWIVASEKTNNAGQEHWELASIVE